MAKPVPKYRPVLNPEDVRLAEEVSRSRTAPRSLQMRSRLALLLHQSPEMANAEAARRIRVHENTVRYWRKIWTTRGFRLEDAPRSGRPPKKKQ